MVKKQIFHERARLGLALGRGVSFQAENPAYLQVFLIKFSFDETKTGMLYLRWRNRRFHVLFCLIGGRMAKKIKQSTSPGKGWAAAFLTAGGSALLYSLLFPLYRVGHFAIAGGLALLLGRVAYIMFSGLDTSQTAPSMEDTPLTGNEAVDKLIARGNDMLAQIRREDELIPDPQLSAQIVQMEQIAGRIFMTVIEQPAKAPQIRRFMDYYLPTTLKMLAGYRKLTDRGVQGREAQATKERIESAMQVVIGAFEKQLETLHRNDMLDITTDIDVLETMLKQDSLLGNEFTISGQSSSGAQAGAQAQMKEEIK
jgi:hypothetical protein